MRERSHEKRQRKALREVLSGISQDHVRQQTQVSFPVEIPGIGEVLCSRVFRVIVGKRIVCLGQAGAGKMIVKLYLARHGARRHWRRSEKGCKAFVEKGIPAPGVLFSGYLPEHGVYALVLEYLEGGTRVDRALVAIHDNADRGAVLDALMAALAHHHARGILQQDLHLGNFMIREGGIYSLDGDQVRALSRPVGRKGSFRNLARLLASLSTVSGPARDARITAYAGARGWEISGRETRWIEKEARRIRDRKLGEYLDKVYRSKDPFVARSDKEGFSVHDRRHEDVSLSAILEAAGQLSRARRAADVPGYSRVLVNGKDMLVCSSTGLGPLLLRRFWPAARVWKNALMLGRLGVETLQPVALVGRRKGLLQWDCSVFFKPAPGITLKELMASGSLSQQDTEQLAENLAGAFSLLGGTGVVMGRVDPEEFLVSGDRIVILGLDAAQRGCPGGRLRQSRALRAFLSQSGVSPAVRKIFIDQFTDRGLI